MTANIVAAEFVDYRLVKSRSVLQIIFELPISNADDAIRLLGGTPQPGATRWVGIAPLEGSFVAAERIDPAPSVSEQLTIAGYPAAPPPPKPKAQKRWNQLTPTEQAAIRCTEPLFWSFLDHTLHQNCPSLYGSVDSVEHAAEAVRTYCEVESRKQLTTSSEAAHRWTMLEHKFYRWSREPVGSGEPV